MRGEIIALVALAALFAVFALITHAGDHDWAGADSEAVGVISEITGGSYHPWFKPIWEPPSKEIESLFFSLQAAIGGIVIGYFLGRYRRASEEAR